MYTIYTDGASRGNPGPAAWAFLILDDEGVAVEMKSGYLGLATNNQAEYNAVIQAIRFARETHILSATVNSDSEIVIRQIIGEYKCKDHKLVPLKATVEELTRGMDVTYRNVPRESRYIQDCDQLCNKTLDAEVRNAKDTHNSRVRSSAQTTW